jgi:hypothetical protein
MVQGWISLHEMQATCVNCHSMTPCFKQIFMKEMKLLFALSFFNMLEYPASYFQSIDHIV